MFVLFIMAGFVLGMLYLTFQDHKEVEHCKSHKWVKHPTNPDNPEEASFLRCDKCGYTVY